MTVELALHAEGVLLPVKALPGSKKNEIRGEQDGALKVSVTQIPEKGKANKTITEFLAKTLGFRKSQVELFSGSLAPRKVFLIRETTLDQVKERIAPFL
ncbi:MAG: DUF167 domain-containing protein [Planctomycetia bacterium]|nr:DUF167 domain-containing protein [Planctomycetia bacterium]